MKPTFRFKTRSEASPPLEAVVLSHDGGGDPQKAMEAWIDPGYGSNLCRFSVGGKNIIDFDSRLLLEHDYTGTPVLYPTPNRVRDGVFRWRGRSYRQTKAGSLIVEHGLVHSERWERSEPIAEAESAALQTWIEFREGAPVFEAFPFPHRLTLEFRLSPRGVAVTYTIENRGNEEIPFGFGLHPYFVKLSGDELTFVTIPADSVMDATPELLPTGKLIDVKGTIYDLHTPTAIGVLDLDHVFTGIRPGAHARIEYRDLGIAVNLEATEDFSHAVLYSPRGEDFFCLENQTCSTDAHNLFDRGFARESGLKTVRPGETHQGRVTYSITF
ncbi:MAG: aldose 1-epimerase [Spirochaetaceae bacterium]|nr:MAG: aldose 1-epimerase [Spirochaetaceae bacterium]